MKNTILFDSYETIVKGNTEEIPSLLDTDSDLVSHVFRGFKYPISSWPVIISNSLKKDLEDACILVPKLLQTIPELYFDNDVEQISDFYFNGDQTMGQFSLMCNQKRLDVSSRLDLTYTEDGFKILEVNMGSSIGGMEFQNFAPLIKELHPTLSGTEQQFISRETQNIYIEFLINKIEQYVSKEDKELGVFIVNGHQGDHPSKKLVGDFFNNLLLKEVQKRGKKGTTYVDTIENLQFTNGELQYNKNKIHAVLILDFALNNITPNIFRALLSDKVYFPDHLGTVFLGDKRNLALLRELAIQGKFSDEENQKVLKYIPWTAVVTNSEVSYKGVSYNLITLLKNQRENFVIKIADGLQGQNVYIGKFCEQQKWETVIADVSRGNMYIAQEFSQSIDLLAPNTANIWAPHKLVWGAFGFGDVYAGTWVRMSANKNDGGVINSANGAVEAIVYESLS
ncbi:hypothetical protein [Kordia sp.]|uniref:hypothetical protein n=1 Tax=Kordia sp. TaxID=1965332 RepID=UPI003B5AF1C8